MTNGPVVQRGARRRGETKYNGDARVPVGGYDERNSAMQMKMKVVREAQRRQTLRQDGRWVR